MEEWRPVVDFEGLYEVSSDGRVRSLPRQVLHYTGKLLHRAGRELRGCITARGYVKVTLCREGAASGKHVHSLVAEAFIGPRPEGHVVRHGDGCSTNNRASNLLYGTQLENSDDMREHGTVLTGEQHPSAKLTAAQVRSMRAERDTSTYAQLAEKYRVSVAQVDNILNRRQWRHV